MKGCLSFIYEQCRHCPLSFYPPAWTGRPLSLLTCAKQSFAGLHELSTLGVHSIDITADLVSSCLTFSPLPLEGGGYFLLHLLTLADHFPLGSGMPCVARTFLSLLWQRQAGSLSVSGCKDRSFNSKFKIIKFKNNDRTSKS